MKTFHIDSYKVPAVDANHIIHVGGWHVLAPEDWELFCTICTYNNLHKCTSVYIWSDIIITLNT